MRWRGLGSGVVGLAMAVLGQGCGAERVTQAQQPPLPPLPAYSRACESGGQAILVETTAPGELPASLSDPGIIRRRFVVIDVDAVQGARSPGSELRLNFFDDVCLDAEVERVESLPQVGGFLLQGRLLGEPLAEVTIVIGRAGVSAISARGPSGLGERSYGVRYASGATHAAIEFDTRVLRWP